MITLTISVYEHTVTRCFLQRQRYSHEFRQELFASARATVVFRQQSQPDPLVGVLAAFPVSEEYGGSESLVDFTYIKVRARWFECSNRNRITQAPDFSKLNLNLFH